MANQCWIQVAIRFTSDEYLDKFIERMKKAEYMRDENNDDAIYMLGAFYLFDHSIELQAKDDAIYVEGWVKWALGVEDAKLFIDTILALYDAERIVIDYSESGSLLFGQYTYDKKSGLVKCLLVGDDNEVWLGDADGEALQHELDNNPVVQILHDYNK